MNIDNDNTNNNISYSTRRGDKTQMTTMRSNGNCSVSIHNVVSVDISEGSRMKSRKDIQTQDIEVVCGDGTKTILILFKANKKDK